MNYFVFRNRRYAYSISQPFEESGEKMVHFTCPKIGIDQDFLAEDIPALILDLPNLAEAEEEYQKTLRQRSVIRFRVSEQDKQNIELNAKKRGFNSVSAFLRAVALEDS